MSKLQSIGALSMLAFALTGAWAQDSTTPLPAEGTAPASKVPKKK